jgi:hypothetical protein
LAARFDTNRDRAITFKVFRAPPDFFGRLDRDRNGKLTAADFDWSEQSPVSRCPPRANG